MTANERFRHRTKSLVGAALILSVVAAGATAGLAQARASKAALTTTVTFSTSVNEFTPGSYNQGAWSGVDSNLTSKDNYFTGFLGAEVYRGYFTFDVSAGTNVCPPLAASLTVPRGHFGSPPPSTLNLGLFDVSTLPATLAQRVVSPNAAIYNDLGSGFSYGSSVLSTTEPGSPYTLSLNDTGLAALGQVRSNHLRWFSIGLGLLSPPAGDAFLFGWTGSAHGDPPVTMAVTLPRFCRVA